MVRTLRINKFRVYIGSRTVWYPKPVGTPRGGRIYNTESEVSISFRKNDENFIIQIKDVILQELGRKNLMQKIKDAIKSTKPKYILVDIDYKTKEAKINEASLMPWIQDIAMCL